MNRKILFATCCLLSALAIAGCAADVSIFYPKSGAAKAADNVIDDIFGAPSMQNTPLAKPSQESIKK